MEKLLLRPVEAAEMLGVGRSTIYELLSNGTIPRVQLGHSVRIPADGLKAWVRERSRGEEGEL